MDITTAAEAVAQQIEARDLINQGQRREAALLIRLDETDALSDLAEYESERWALDTSGYYTPRVTLNGNVRWWTNSLFNCLYVEFYGVQDDRPDWVEVARLDLRYLGLRTVSAIVASLVDARAETD